MIRFQPNLYPQLRGSKKPARFETVFCRHLKIPKSLWCSSLKTALSRAGRWAGFGAYLRRPEMNKFVTHGSQVCFNAEATVLATEKRAFRTPR